METTNENTKRLGKAHPKQTLKHTSKVVNVLLNVECAVRVSHLGCFYIYMTHNSYLDSANDES